MNSLEQLKNHSTVVADTGDFGLLERYKVQDATTNPSLILKAARMPEYAPLVRDTVGRFRKEEPGEVVDRILVRIGCEILQRVPGRVSTEVDARLSFDADATVDRGMRIVDMYRAEGVNPDRVLVKIAATWEGIQAARVLQQRGIRTNLTLLFSLCQAIACADANVQLISPFVGRIYDWYKNRAGANWVQSDSEGGNDPGVRSVREVHAYFKRFDVSTEIMGASFRNIGQIIALAGCDLLTISPELLEQLAVSELPVVRVLDGSGSQAPNEPIAYAEQAFRSTLAQNVMASEKLTEGIASFSADTQKLEELIAST